MTSCKRYDRAPGAPAARIHQEDFNQVLGARGNEKYQKYGGRVSLARIAQVIARLGDRTALERLFKLVVVSVAVGNLDLHAKNISLLHPLEGAPTLAPAYDVVPQAHQPNDGEVALAVGGEYRHAAITLEHLEAEAGAWGLPDAARLAAATLEVVLETVSTEQPHPAAHTTLVPEISAFTTNLLAGREVGRG